MGSTASRVQEDLIYDLGMNHGEDTQFYLDKGFRVVGVEADPALTDELRTRFAKSMASGQLNFEPVGLTDERGRRSFHRNLANDQWSSFNPPSARTLAKFESVEVDCVTLADLVAKYGCPYYLKINLPGLDRKILAKLPSIVVRPIFLSVEEFDAGTINALFALGYNTFSLRPQHDKSWARLPYPPQEGLFVARTFTRRDSGPFGREAAGWMSVNSARRSYHQLVRRLGKDGIGPPDEWYDLHATHWPRAIDDVSLEMIDDRTID